MHDTMIFRWQDRSDRGAFRAAGWDAELRAGDSPSVDDSSLDSRFDDVLREFVLRTGSGPLDVAERPHA